MTELSNILTDYESLKTAIDKSISEKIFIRKGFRNDIHKLSEEIQIYSISNLLKDNTFNYNCICIPNIIEWTPVKLFQSVYFMVFLYDKFWIINRDSNKCMVVSVLNMVDYIKRLHQNDNINSQYLNNSYWANQNEFIHSLNILKNNEVAYIKQVSYNKKLKLNHYLYKDNEYIYYMVVCYLDNSVSMYKPIIYCSIDSFNQWKSDNLSN